MRVHPAGRAPVLSCLLISLALMVMCRWLPHTLVWPAIVLAAFLLAGACFLLYFYRDPERQPDGSGLLSAPMVAWSRSST